MRNLFTLARIAYHTVLLFGLPWLVGALTAMLCDVSEVTQASRGSVRTYAFFAVPALLVQLAALARKVSRDSQGRTLLDALDLHVRTLTGTGSSLFLGSLACTSLALSAGWAELGVLAVTGLGLPGGDAARMAPLADEVFRTLRGRLPPWRRIRSLYHKLP